MHTWPVYYYKKAKYYFIAFIPAILAVFAPSILINIDKDLLKKYEWLFEKSTFVAMAIFMVGLIAAIMIKSIKRKSILTIRNGELCFMDKCINLTNANISFGKYGVPAGGSHGSVLHMAEGKRTLKIAIPYYTAENPNYYTQNWTMNVDCFMEKEDIKNFLPIIEKKQKIEASQVNAFNKNELVFELRSNIKAGKTLLLFYAFLAIPIVLLIILNVTFKINNGFITALLTLSGFGAFIYFLIKKGKKGTGFYMTIQNGMVSFLHLESRKEIFSGPVNSVESKVYIGNLSGRGYSLYYLMMKLKVPGFKNITIGQVAPWGRNMWQGRNFKEKWLFFSPPDYIIDEQNWEKLAGIFNIHV